MCFHFIRSYVLLSSVVDNWFLARWISTCTRSLSTTLGYYKQTIKMNSDSPFSDGGEIKRCVFISGLWTVAAHANHRGNLCSVFICIWVSSHLQLEVSTWLNLILPLGMHARKKKYFQNMSVWPLTPLTSNIRALQVV